MWYGDQRESVCNLGYALQVEGWKLYGVKADESDSMTDYYSPASWDGIATKNGFTLVVDNPTLSYSGHKVQRRVQNSKTVNTQDLYGRIEKLQNMTTDRGASQQEEETAKAAIEKLQAKIKENSNLGWKVVDVYPEFKNANPVNYNWHIEDKNGVIIAMGTGAFQFAFISWMWDFENKKPNRDTVNESTQEKVTAMYKLVDKIEKAIKNPSTCMVQKEVKKIKRALGAVKVDSVELPKDGMYFRLTTGFTNGGRKGDVYQVHGADEKSFLSYKLNGKLNKVLTGKASGNKLFMTIESFVKSLAKGSIEIVEIKEVEQVETTVKWTKEKYSYCPEVNEETLITASEPAQEQPKEKVKTEVKQEKKEAVKATKSNQELSKDELTIEMDTNEKLGGLEIKFNGKPRQEVREVLKTNGFRWHKIKGIWWTKDSQEAREFLCNYFLGTQEDRQAQQEESTIKVDIVEDVKQEEKTNYTMDIQLNEVKKGIEVTPSGELPQEVKDSLRKFGFVWFSSLRKYISKQTPERLEFIKTLQAV